MKNYYVGLDIGTDSVGWATTGEDYSLSKFNGNAMWGVRLLEQSKTADERRSFRGARRRNDRKKYRIQCLEMLFDEAISKIDVAFFQRLKESSFYEDDKRIGTKYSLFSDAGFTDKDYYKKYPTIYHLRKDLIESSDEHDVRLVYLAVSHIIKHRGHFLFDSQLSDSFEIADFSDLWSDFNAFLFDNYELSLDCSDMALLESALKDTTLTKTKKKELIAELLSVKKKTDKQKYELITLLTGGSAKTCDLFANEEYKDCECKTLILSSGYDENGIVYESVLKDDFELVENAKAIYDWAVLSSILKNNKYISFAKVGEYEKHKSDLKLLKTFVRKYCPEKYGYIFKVNKKGVCNYVAYSSHSKLSIEETNCSQEKFCEFLKGALIKDLPDSKYEVMYSEIVAGTFMPKPVTKDNSVIPMQVTRAELETILERASAYLPFLNDKDENDITVKEKILSIHSYRVPYYVGPLNLHSDKHWLVRNSEKIYPWNFDKVVDGDKSAEKFIEKLTSKCTYLPVEDVIPKYSLLYSSFMVLNEINNLKINGEPISVELKKSIYQDLFAKRNKVTQKALLSYLKSRGYIDISLSGIDGDFKSNLKSYRDLLFLDITETEKEDIIKAITIFGDDKKLLKRRLKQQYGSVISDEDIKSLCKLKYSGWSRLSKKFLASIEGVIGSTGELTTIIRALWETNNNLMQLLGNENTFTDSIAKENAGEEFTSLKAEVEALYVSPKIKRPIYQTMLIVEEIVKIKGVAPKKIFVEVARGPEEKKRTVSRKNKLLELYKTCKKQEMQLYEQLCNFDEADLRRDALYLYFTQFGKCMYTGEHIEITELFNKNIYDIDHIFPQSKIKDDSLDNRVLVLKTENEKKGNIYPIASTIRDNMQEFWKTLESKGLISKKKLERLMRVTPLADEELSSFIARQLVETRQSTKAIAQLLRKRYPDTEVVYVKANNVSEFRKSYDFVKCREVNDFHHAKDAYLNIVVGNVYNTQFNHNRLVYISGLQSGKYSVRKMFNYNVKGAWTADADESISMVRKMMNKNNIRFTRYSYKQKGGLFDQNILKKGNGQVPIKGTGPLSDISKYGGYNRATSTYFALAEYVEKGKAIRVIVPVDLHNESKYCNCPETYIAQAIGVDNVKIIVPCIKYNAMISINGFRLHISSKSSGGATYVCKPAMQLVLGNAKEEYIKNISNYLAKCTQWKQIKEITQFDCFTAEGNIELYDTLADKLLNTIFKVKFERLGNILLDKKAIFVALSVYEQCVVLMEILKILHANVLTGDLTFIGEAKKSGVTSIGNKVIASDKIKSFKLIHQSVTGLFEQEVELLG